MVVVNLSTKEITKMKNMKFNTESMIDFYIIKFDLPNEEPIREKIVENIAWIINKSSYRNEHLCCSFKAL